VGFSHNCSAKVSPIRLAHAGIRRRGKEAPTFPPVTSRLRVNGQRSRAGQGEVCLHTLIRPPSMPGCVVCFSAAPSIAGPAQHFQRGRDNPPEDMTVPVNHQKKSSVPWFRRRDSRSHGYLPQNSTTAYKDRLEKP